jgi:hypothetical protein
LAAWRRLQAVFLSRLYQMRAALTGFAIRHLAVLGAFASLAACGDAPSGPEDELREWVRRGHQAAENRDPATLIGMVSPAYADARGNSRDDIGNLLRLWFLQQSGAALLTRIDELAVHDGTAANVVVQVAMAGTDNGALGLTADTQRFELELVRDGEDWLLLSARWGEPGGAAH